MADGGVRQDAVTEIENMRAPGKGMDDVVHPRRHRIASGAKPNRIEIALQRQCNMIAGEVERRHLIEADAIDARLGGRGGEPASQQQVPVSFSGEEGRVYEGLERAFRTPTYTVTSASPSTIDLSDGTQLTISGTNMPGQILVRWYSGTTYLESTANGCADVCNSVTAPPPAGITPGTYEIVAHLSVFTQETVVGLGNVTVVP